MEKKRVLFLCTGNSCRSQMAEGFLRHLGGDRFDAYSAGTNPTQVNPLSIEAMKELDIDISAQKSKPASEFIGQKFDYLITVCDNAKQTCPAFAGGYTKFHWNLKDPAEAEGREEEKMAIFRELRDKIRVKIEEFIDNCAQQSLLDI